MLYCFNHMTTLINGAHQLKTAASLLERTRKYIPLLDTSHESVNYTIEDGKEMLHRVEPCRDHIWLELDDTSPTKLCARLALDRAEPKGESELTRDIPKTEIQTIPDHMSDRATAASVQTPGTYLQITDELRRELKTALANRDILLGSFEILSVVHRARRGTAIEESFREESAVGKFRSEVRYQERKGKESVWWCSGFSGYTQCSSENGTVSVTDTSKNKEGFQYMSTGNAKAKKEYDVCPLRMNWQPRNRAQLRRRCRLATLTRAIP